MLALAAVCVATSATAAITVTDAKIQGGKLIITGSTTAAKQQIKLDNRFTARSNAAKVFTFGLTNYLPVDCVVDLKAGSESATAVVADCGPKGLTPRGAWSAGLRFLANDLATFGGSTWRAKANNIGKQPDTNPAIWEVFAAKGNAGPSGPTGGTGAQGAQGDVGILGPAGPKGATGPSPQGSQGSRGTSEINAFGSVATFPAIITNTSFQFVFIGTPVTVSVGAGQRLTASMSVPLRNLHDPPTLNELRFHLCYSPTGTTNLTLFMPNGDLIVRIAAAGWITAATSATTVVSNAGDYDVGLCMRLDDADAVIQFDYAKGWVDVTDN